MVFSIISTLGGPIIILGQIHPYLDEEELPSIVSKMVEYPLWETSIVWRMMNLSQNYERWEKLCEKCMYVSHKEHQCLVHNASFFLYDSRRVSST